MRITDFKIVRINFRKSIKAARPARTKAKMELVVVLFESQTFIKIPKKK